MTAWMAACKTVDVSASSERPMGGRFARDVRGAGRARGELQSVPRAQSVSQCVQLTPRVQWTRFPAT